MRRLLLLFLFTFCCLGVFWGSAPDVQAARVCRGSRTCCSHQSLVCNPVGCDVYSDSGCTCNNQCVGTTYNAQCEWINGWCTTNNPYQGGANWVCPTTGCYVQDIPDEGGGGGGNEQPPLPGGWQGCGSCSSCGHDSGQCVTNPSGQCLWDPTYCGTGNGGGGGGPPPPPPCYPSCSAQCGQGDGCGGTCGSSDFGIPGIPTVAAPAAGVDAVADLQNRVSLSWNGQSLADRYRIEIWPTLNPTGVDLTSPAGSHVIASAGTTSQNSRQRAFDNSLSSYWASHETGAAVNGAAWVGQDFGATPSAYRQITKVVVRQSANANQRVASVRVQYSDDLTSWTNVATQTLEATNTPQEFSFPASGSHRAWRLLANAPLSGNNQWVLYDIEMMIDGPVTPSQIVTSNGAAHNMVASSREYTIRVRAENITCANQIGDWSSVRSFYVSSPVTGMVYLDSNSAATMNGNLCTGPTTAVNTSEGDVTSMIQAISSGDINTTTARRALAFDNNTGTYWGSSQRGPDVNGNAWVGQDFGEASESAKHIRKITLRQNTDNRYNVRSLHVEWSDDAETWQRHETLAVNNDGNPHTYVIDSSGPHRYWRVRANEGLAAGLFWVVRELEMQELSGGDVGQLTVLGRDWQNFSEQAVVDQSGAYTVHLPYSVTGTNTVSLVINNGQFICSCPAGCVYGGLDSPLADVNFYVTDAQHPWFQVQGGAVMAHQPSGTAIKNPIPTICTEEEGCKPYMITRSGGANTSGYVLTGGGDVDLRFESGVQSDIVDEDGENRLAVITNRAAQERYEYFTRLYKFPANPQDDFHDSALNAQKPLGTPANSGVPAFYHGGDLVINESWQVNDGESIVIFVNGNLEIRNTIRVAQGGFLSFIVKGNIIIDPSVGNDDIADNTPNVEGMFVANGSIRLPGVGVAQGGDKRFVGAGTFVGWSGIVMERDYDDGVDRRLLNNTNPTELFIYRPDLVLRTPAQMRAPRYQWREVAP